LRSYQRKVFDEASIIATSAHEGSYFGEVSAGRPVSNSRYLLFLHSDACFGDDVSEELNTPLEQRTLGRLQFKIRSSDSSEDLVEALQLLVETSSEYDDVVQIHQAS